MCTKTRHTGIKEKSITWRGRSVPFVHESLCLKVGLGKKVAAGW